VRVCVWVCMCVRMCMYPDVIYWFRWKIGTLQGGRWDVLCKFSKKLQNSSTWGGTKKGPEAYRRYLISEEERIPIYEPPRSSGRIGGGLTQRRGGGVHFSTGQTHGVTGGSGKAKVTPGYKHARQKAEGCWHGRWCMEFVHHCAEVP
jgi:hypothetical protein